MYIGKTDILNPEGPWLKFHQRMLVLCNFICYRLTCSNFLFFKVYEFSISTFCMFDSYMARLSHLLYYSFLPWNAQHDTLHIPSVELGFSDCISSKHHWVSPWEHNLNPAKASFCKTWFSLRFTRAYPVSPYSSEARLHVSYLLQHTGPFQLSNQPQAAFCPFLWLLCLAR